MSQLKFVRSKSTSRSNPLRRLKQQLKQVQKPGKLYVSVGRSRQSSQPNEELPISTPRNKMDLKLLQLHQINENTVPLQQSVGWQSLLPLSHDARIINDSNKPPNSTQYNGNWGNSDNKQHYYTQTNYCRSKQSESANTDKLYTYQVQSTKLNSSGQLSNSANDSNTTSKFNFNQIALKQSQKINQQLSSDTKQCRLYSSTHSNTNTKFKNESDIYEQINHQQKNEKFESIILDIYPTSARMKQVKTKPIIEQNEDEELQGMKCSIIKIINKSIYLYSIILSHPKRKYQSFIVKFYVIDHFFQMCLKDLKIQKFKLILLRLITST